MFLKNLFLKTRPAIAVFIDAENVSPKNIHSYMKEISSHGKVCVKEAFACGTLFESPNWKNPLLLHAIKPRQGLRAKKGKNTADIALTARAVQVFYKINPDITYIISGDSDYSPLVQLLRQENHEVIVIAKMNASDSYINSVSNLIFEETLQDIHRPDPEKKQAPRTNNNANLPVIASGIILRRASRVTPAQQLVSQKRVQPKAIDHVLLDRAYDMAPKGITGTPTAGNFNNSLKKLDSGFHYKNYGFTTFKKFILSLHPRFEMISNENNNIYIKKNI